MVRISPEGTLNVPHRIIVKNNTAQSQIECFHILQTNIGKKTLKAVELGRRKLNVGRFAGRQSNQPLCRVWRMIPKQRVISEKKIKVRITNLRAWRRAEKKIHLREQNTLVRDIID